MRRQHRRKPNERRSLPKKGPGRVNSKRTQAYIKRQIELMKADFDKDDLLFNQP